MYEAGGAAVLEVFNLKLFQCSTLECWISMLHGPLSNLMTLAQTRLLCLENTTDGKVIEVEDLYEGRTRR